MVAETMGLAAEARSLPELVGQLEDVGIMLRIDRSVTPEAVRTNTEVLVGSVPPIGVFWVARLLGAEVTVGAEIALWFTVALLACAGAAAAYLAGVRGLKLLLETLIAGGFGVVVIFLKYALH
jgi:hypothetical protein